MALITRVSRLFRADLHAVLDRLEEPDALLRQAVRDMEEDLAGDRQRNKMLDHEQQLLGSRCRDIEQSLRELDQELDICFASEKDQLARALIKRKLEAQRVHKFVLSRRQALEQTLDSLAARIEENQVRLDSMRQKVELLDEEQGSAAVESDWTVPDCPVRDEDIEVAFLREQQKRRSP